MFVLVLVGMWSAATHASQGPNEQIKPLFPMPPADAGGGDFVRADEEFTALATAATDSIDIAMYGVNRKSVRHALRACQQIIPAIRPPLHPAALRSCGSA